MWDVRIHAFLSMPSACCASVDLKTSFRSHQMQQEPAVLLDLYKTSDKMCCNVLMELKLEEWERQP